jgi:hypothetical protein
MQRCARMPLMLWWHVLLIRIGSKRYFGRCWWIGILACELEPLLASFGARAQEQPIEWSR